MSLTAGYTKVCEARSGGLVEIYFANVDDVTSFTLTTDQYSAVTMEVAKVFYKYEFEQDTAELRENGTRENGSTQYTHELEFLIAKLSTDARKAIQALFDCSPCGLIAIAKDNNGKMWVLGYSESFLKERPLKALTDTTTSGVALTDQNGSTVVMQSIDAHKAIEFTGTIPV